jgi:hypothetical protein
MKGHKEEWREFREHNKKEKSGEGNEGDLTIHVLGGQSHHGQESNFLVEIPFNA